MDSSLAGIGRREQQKLEREHRILAAARKLFDRQGYGKTSMEEVAERAGLAVGTLYNYFHSKNDLLLAIMRRESDRLLRIGERILANPPADPNLAIAAMADLFVEAISTDERMLWRELFAASISSPDELGARLLKLDRELIAQLSTLIDHLRSSRMLAPDVDPAQAARTIYGICLSWQLAFITNENISVDAMRNGISAGIRLLLRGMLSRPSEKPDGRKFEVESLNQRSEVPAKPEASGYREAEKPAGHVRSEKVSQVEKGKAAASHADVKSQEDARRSVQGVARETLPAEEWYRLRNLIVAHFGANPQKSYWLTDLVQILKVESELLRSVLNDVKKEGIVEEYHPGLWRLKKP